MIPKIIHYCWFGKEPEPNSVKKLKENWKYTCQMFEIRRWDESNFSYQNYEYTNVAYANKRFDLVSDFARLFVLKEFGGIYLDVDVELVKPLDELLMNECFFGLEDFDSIASGLICGAVPQEKNVCNLLSIYLINGGKINFMNQNCVDITTQYFRSLGFKYKDTVQLINGCKIYESGYFCPIKYGSRKMSIISKTISIHHYKKVSNKTRRHIIEGRILRRIIGRDLFNRFVRKIY